LPPEFKLPPPRVPDWQRPESDFKIGGPWWNERVQGLPAASLRPDQLLIYNDRGRRDAARMGDFLFPGSGNFISGDRDLITEGDVVRLGASLGTTLALGPLGLEGAPTRAVTGAVRAASEAAPIARSAPWFARTAPRAGGAVERSALEAEAQAAGAGARTAAAEAPVARTAPFVGKLNAAALRPPQPFEIPALPPKPAAPPGPDWLTRLSPPRRLLLPPPPKRLALPPPPERLALPAPPQYPLLANPGPGTQQSWDGLITQ